MHGWATTLQDGAPKARQNGKKTYAYVSEENESTEMKGKESMHRWWVEWVSLSARRLLGRREAPAPHDVARRARERVVAPRLRVQVPAEQRGRRQPARRDLPRERVVVRRRQRGQLVRRVLLHDRVVCGGHVQYHSSTEAEESTDRC
jgi:hypothetical protein